MGVDYKKEGLVMWEKISNFLKGQLATSVIYIILGCCLAFMPVGTVNVISKFVFGILLIAAGIYHIVLYVAEKLNSTILDLFAGGVMIVLGSFLFMNPQVIVKLLPMMLGTFIIVDSIWTLKGALKLKKREQTYWKFLLIGSLIFIGLGSAMIANPFSVVKYTVMFAGWIFLVNGIVDIIYLFLLRKGLKELKQEMEAVDADGVFIGEGAEQNSSADTGQTAPAGTMAEEVPAVSAPVETPVVSAPEEAPVVSAPEEAPAEPAPWDSRPQADAADGSTADISPKQTTE